MLPPGQSKICGFSDPKNLACREEKRKRREGASCAVWCGWGGGKQRKAPRKRTDEKPDQRPRKNHTTAAAACHCSFKFSLGKCLLPRVGLRTTSIPDASVKGSEQWSAPGTANRKQLGGEWEGRKGKEKGWHTLASNMEGGGIPHRHQWVTRVVLGWH